MYGKHIVTDSGVYSIDKLIVEVWFPPCTPWDGEILKTTFELQGLKYFADYGLGTFEEKKLEGKMWLTHRFRYVMPQCESGVIVELLERRMKGRMASGKKDEDGEPTGEKVSVSLGSQYGVRIQFNPNKHLESPIIRRFFDWYHDVGPSDMGLEPFWRWRRVDYAFDVAKGMEELLLLSRKEEAYQYGTRYYGRRGKNGHTRMYDKQKEYNRHVFHKDKLTAPLTRFEWEQHNEQDLTFDTPLYLGELPPRMPWLRFIKLEEMNHCLDTLDRRTKKKIKESCFQAIPFDTTLFDRLLEEYREEFGLDLSRHGMTLKEYMDKSQQESLERFNEETDTAELESEFYNNRPAKSGGTEDEGPV